MMNVLITRQESIFEKYLANAFIREGYNVITADTDVSVDCIDLYIDVSDERDEDDKFTVLEGMDEAIIKKVYEKNVLDPLKMFEKYLPFLDAGTGKRVCFLTSKEASINGTRDTNGYAYKLSKAAIHNFYQMAMNRLSPGGYTIRIYDPMHGEIDAEASAEGAFNYFTRQRGSENNDPRRNDENRRVIRDASGREHAW